ncbi:MAG: SpaA isopeptide-forming pilin-related protein [Coprobacillaceae bacterium]
MIHENSAGGSVGAGGAISLWTDCTLQITDSEIYQNSAKSIGGALDLSYTSLTVENSKIYNNNAVVAGGGIYIQSRFESKYTCLISNSEIYDNSTKDGAGIYGYNFSIEIENSKVYNNVALSNGGGIYVIYEAGINIAPLDRSLLTIKSGAVTDNEATNGDGGGIYLYDFQASGLSQPSNFSLFEMTGDSDSVILTRNTASVLTYIQEHDETLYEDNYASKLDDNSPSMTDTALNNYDINYRRSDGETINTDDKTCVVSAEIQGADGAIDMKINDVTKNTLGVDEIYPVYEYGNGQSSDGVSVTFSLEEGYEIIRYEVNNTVLIFNEKKAEAHGITFTLDESTNKITFIATEDDFHIVAVVEPEEIPVYTLTVLKIDKETKEPLFGAVFEITKDTYKEEGTSGIDGTIDFELPSNPEGVYIIQETTAPSGYEALSESVTITVDENGVVIAVTGSAIYQDAILMITNTKESEEIPTPTPLDPQEPSLPLEQTPNTNPPVVNNVSTGDSVNIVILIIMLMGTSVILKILGKKKKRNNRVTDIVLESYKF